MATATKAPSKQAAAGGGLGGLLIVGLLLLGLGGGGGGDKGQGEQRSRCRAVWSYPGNKQVIVAGGVVRSAVIVRCNGAVTGYTSTLTLEHRTVVKDAEQNDTPNVTMTVQAISAPGLWRARIEADGAVDGVPFHIHEVSNARIIEEQP